ncbi:MAG: Crp/Fnr family transcriptional regulator [Saprospiraceae bacterium]
MINSSIFLMLREFKILKSLSEKQLEEMTKEATLNSIDKNAIIYSPGDECKYVYLVQKGSVKLGMHAQCGKILIKDIVYEGSLFGENIFLEGNSRKEFAKVMYGTTVIKIPVTIIKSMVVENSDFANDIMGVILLRIQNLEERMQSFVFKKAKRRIMDFIKRTGNLRGIKIGLEEVLINHGMSHKEIGYLTDTSRQTVARVLGDLKRENLIHFSTRKPNKILIRKSMSFA